MNSDRATGAATRCRLARVARWLLVSGATFCVITPSASARLEGSARDDDLVGTPRPDRIDAGGGDDSVDGREGADMLRGGAGADDLFGNVGADWLVGGSGPDTLSGGPGADLLVGGEGADDIVGGGGQDRVWSGPGNDFVDVRSGEPDLAACGSGFDIVRLDPSDRVLSGCERQTFLTVLPREGSATRTRTMRFVKQGPGYSDGDVLEVSGPPGTRCERLHALHAVDGPLEGFDVGDIGTFRYGVRLTHAPERRRFHPRTRDGDMARLCSGRYRVELKVEYCGEDGPCGRTRALERTYFTVR